MSVMVPSGPLFRYGLSVAAVVLALLLTALFQPFLDRSLFLLFFGAVIISAWFGGMDQVFSPLASPAQRVSTFCSIRSAPK